MADEVSIAVVALRADLSDFRKEMKTLGPEAAKAADDMTWAMLRQLKAVEKAQKEHTQKIKKEQEEAAKAAKKAAEDAAAAQKKAAAEAAAAAQKSAKATGKSFGEISKALMQNQAISQAETIAAMFITVGGSVSQVAMLVTSAIRPVATLSAMLKQAFGPQAPLILGLAAVPVAAAATVLAIKAVADSGLAARDHLKELGYQLGAEQVDALNSYEHALSQLSVTMSRIKVAVGEEAAPAIDRFTTALGMMAAEAERQMAGHDENRLFGLLPLPGDPVFDGLRLMRDQLLDFSNVAGRVVRGIATVGGTEWFRLLKDSMLGATDETIRLREHAYRLAEAQKEASLAAGEHAKALKENKEWAEKAVDAYVALGMMVSVEEENKEKRDALAAATRAAAEAERTRNEYLQANENILRESAAAEKELTAARAEAYSGAFLPTLAVLHDLKGAYAELDKAQKNIVSSLQAVIDRQQRFQDIANLTLSTTSSFVSAFDSVADAMLSTAQAHSAAIEESTQADRDRIQELRDNYRQMLADEEFSSKAAAQKAKVANEAEIARIRARIDSRREELAEQKKAAEVAYALSQSFAITQSMISAASMAIGMAAQMAPYAGPAAPIVAATLAGTMLAAQLAAIAAAPPPEFPMGGMVSPDHHMVAVRGTEGVLTDRGLRNLGGERELARLNAGGEMPSPDGPETVRLLTRIANAVQPPRGPSVVRASHGRRG